MAPRIEEQTQPTVPQAGSYSSSPTTTVPAQTTTTVASGNKVSPSLKNPNVSDDSKQGYSISAIGVKGSRLYDADGNLIKYEGYKYFRGGPEYGTTSGAGAATGTRMVPTGQAVEPKYFSGDEDAIYGYSAEQLSNIQRAMNSVGLLGDKYTPGLADSATRAAYRNLLEEANGYGEDFETAIIRRASTGAGGRKGQLTQYRVSSEADIKNVINRVAQQSLGRKLGEGDLTRLAKMYRELEKEAGLAAGGSQQEVEAAPSPEAFAESQLGQMFPEETNAREFGSYIQAIKERYQL